MEIYPQQGIGQIRFGMTPASIFLESAEKANFLLSCTLFQQDCG